MLKNIFVFILFVSSNLFAITKSECLKKGEDFVFVKNECINYKAFVTDEDALNIIVHGTWDEGTDIIARYSPFAEDISMRTDVSTIALALPGYSESTSENYKAIGNKEQKNLAATKKYVDFFIALVEELKKEFESTKTTIIAHSAGCMLSATAIGIKPYLVDNLVCAGGVYDIHKKSPQKGLISAVDVIDKISKDTKIVLIYGSDDKVSTPKMSKDFYNLAKKKGLNVELVEVKNAAHMDLEMQKESLEAIENLFE